MKNYTKKTIEFYEKNVDTYTKNGVVVLNEKIDRFTKLLLGKKILDVACGPGHDTDYLTKKGFDCIGIDLSKKMIEYAKKTFKGKFELIDFLQLKFKKNSFDGIWCSSALIHVDKKNINKTLKDFSKILKRFGILGIITPTNQERIKKTEDTRIFTMFDKSELERYLLKNKFEIIDSELFFFDGMKWIFITSKNVKK